MIPFLVIYDTAEGTKLGTSHDRGWIYKLLKLKQASGSEGWIMRLIFYHKIREHSCRIFDFKEDATFTMLIYALNLGKYIINLLTTQFLLSFNIKLFSYA
jgi:hypothetical protein